MWHVSSRSGVATLRTAIHLLLTYLLRAGNVASWGTKVCRYNWHSADSLGWPFPVLKDEYVFRTKYTEPILSNSTWRLLRFEISKMMISGQKIIVLFIIIFGTLSFPTYIGSSEVTESMPRYDRHFVGITRYFALS